MTSQTYKDALSKVSPGDAEAAILAIADFLNQNTEYKERIIHEPYGTENRIPITIIGPKDKRTLHFKPIKNPPTPHETLRIINQNTMIANGFKKNMRNIRPLPYITSEIPPESLAESLLSFGKTIPL